MFLSSQDTVLTIQYFCKFGIVKTYNMSIIDCEQLEAVYSLEESANHLVISARLQSDDTVLVNKEKNPNVISSRCTLFQENDHNTQIFQSDEKLSFVNNQNNALKVNQSIRSLLFSNFQAKDNSTVHNLEGNTKTVVLHQNSLWDQTALKASVLSSTITNQESTLGGQTVLVADSDDDE
ncbi:hypothetical protein Smp_173880 [Schistosoma mansoni]|uniref:hypothetical protein n=1 Tax=Schistosoma mansoni TaxID=6183 RepID=UPI0001A61BCF|nr:hypothetical protein Smp_173880 [Schistosoma mansoni]|eukprot:XP_018650072.1 hypothetical protein Smp_173880 [Schistosoma mansoni]